MSLNVFECICCKGLIYFSNINIYVSFFCTWSFQCFAQLVSASTRLGEQQIRNGDPHQPGDVTSQNAPSRGSWAEQLEGPEMSLGGQRSSHRHH